MSSQKKSSYTRVVKKSSSAGGSSISVHVTESSVESKIIAESADTTIIDPKCSTSSTFALDPHVFYASSELQSMESSLQASQGPISTEQPLNSTSSFDAQTSFSAGASSSALSITSSVSTSFPTVDLLATMESSSSALSSLSTLSSSLVTQPTSNLVQDTHPHFASTNNSPSINKLSSDIVKSAIQSAITGSTELFDSTSNFHVNSPKPGTIQQHIQSVPLQMPEPYTSTAITQSSPSLQQEQEHQHQAFSNMRILPDDPNVAHDFLFKIVIVGESGVGKTNLLTRFTRDSFTLESKSTVGVEFSTITLQLGGRIIRAQLWDTAGQERYRAITHAYYRGAVGALIVYDITRRQTFEEVQRWYSEIKEMTNPSLIVMLVGNKADLERNRQVSQEEGIEMARKHSFFFIETSALANQNVGAAFEVLLTEIHRVMMKAQFSGMLRASSSGKKLPTMSGEESNACAQLSSAQQSAVVKLEQGKSIDLSMPADSKNSRDVDRSSFNCC